MTQLVGPKQQRKRWFPRAIHFFAITMIFAVLLNIIWAVYGYVMPAETDQLTDAEGWRLFALRMGAASAIVLVIYLAFMAQFYLVRRDARYVEQVNDEASAMLDQFELAHSDEKSAEINEEQRLTGALVAVVVVTGLIYLVLLTPVVYVFWRWFVWLVPIFLIFGYLRHWSVFTEYAQGQNRVFGKQFWAVIRYFLVTGMIVDAFGFGFIFAAMLLNRVFDSVLISVFVLGIVVFGLLRPAVLWWTRFRLFMMMRALRKLDYERAQARLPVQFASEQVFILICMGRLAEAETLLAELVRAERRKIDKFKRREVFLLIQLSFLRFAQGNYADFQPLLQAGQTILSIEGSDDPTKLAIASLNQDIDAPQALILAERGVKLKQEKWLVSTMRAYHGLADARAVQAWALAKNDQSEQARHVAREALAQSERYLPLSRANVHLYVGHTFAALGEPSTAREHFEHAAQLVPVGLVGQQAQQSLASHS